VISTGALLSTCEVPLFSTDALSEEPQPASVPAASDAMVNNANNLFFIYLPSLSVPIFIVAFSYRLCMNCMCFVGKSQSEFVKSFAQDRLTA
jgi:hypothetical protein